ncbi:MAG: undecaprenyl pyrophosphate phosphatase [Sodalis sp. Psp]|nr:undecaprenyl pyrophosphate phosphatase [Sodalis sp. Psp]MCR3756914.1 undecaprenyl pyrophosphate phosphatase [Sodalis sp. Ppy]
MTILIPEFEQLNFHMFQLINAPTEVSVVMLRVGIFFANDAVALFPLVLLFNWFWQGEENKKTVLFALINMLFALAINVAISMIWQHPRPFMIPLGQHLLYCASNNSFPSNHMSLACAISFSLIASSVLRWQGMLLFVLSVLVAWARIYVGVHFPLDMMVSLGVACVSTALSLRCANLADRIYAYVYPRYYALFAVGIRRGVFK